MESTDLTRFSYGKKLHDERWVEFVRFLGVLFFVVFLYIFSKDYFEEYVLGFVAILLFFGGRTLMVKPVIYQNGLGWCWFGTCLRFIAWEDCTKIELKAYYQRIRQSWFLKNWVCRYKVFFSFPETKPMKINFLYTPLMIKQLGVVFTHHPDLKRKVSSPTLDLSEREKLKQTGFYDLLKNDTPE